MLNDAGKLNRCIVFVTSGEDDDAVNVEMHLCIKKYINTVETVSYVSVIYRDFALGGYEEKSI